MKNLHEPVLTIEVLEGLLVGKLEHLKNNRFIDATVGFGGHAGLIIENGGFVLGIDADKKSLEIAENNLKKACPDSYRPVAVSTPSKKFKGCFKLVQGNFKDIDKIAKSEGFYKVQGVLFDLGVSSLQLTSPDRGFSFQNPDAELDMRIDPDNQSVKASDLLQILGKSQLIDLFAVVMPKDEAFRLTRRILEARRISAIRKVKDLLPLVQLGKVRNRSINPATVPFMALRMAVNSELENLNEVLPKAYSLLVSGGRLAVISFHSGEDRIVKNFSKEVNKEGSGKIITKKPIIPSEEEIENNPRARSAKLRILEKI